MITLYNILFKLVLGSVLQSLIQYLIIFAFPLFLLDARIILHHNINK